eukprot:TRINITY_DN17673_c0_g1_i1.p2 TRINITY_DN17673_c0_g1~~TRINITY_DN17673_c0_g1_i1.p2  ORF type:complete len:401 (+),score=110.33 TRINITY_DN17673_c0_g1_i1:72-1274(+)
MPALSGIKVIELGGIGPGPLGACVLADFGADVVTVERASGGRILSQADPVSRGKRSVAVDLKSPAGLGALKEMLRTADVFIEPYRPGVAEKLGLGPDELRRANPRLIYARMTGWGQGGDVKFGRSAGHDANYISISGALSLFRRNTSGDSNERPSPPANFAGDYAGGGMMMAMGVLLALVERQRSGEGQVVDAAMVDGANYAALPIFKWVQSGFMPTRPDGNIDVDKSVLHQAPHFVQIYECKDGRWVSVQAIEPQFYKVLVKGLGLDQENLPPQGDRLQWAAMKKRFEEVFRTKTRDEWARIFYASDACVAPVLLPQEAARHPHNVARGSFAPTPERPGEFEPVPAPRLSRTPGFAPRPQPAAGGDTAEVLADYGFSAERARALCESGAVIVGKRKARL